MTATTFTVPGVPRPQGSKRHVGNGIMVEQSKHVRPWRATVSLAAERAHTGPLLDGPVRVHADFYFPRPRSHYWTGKRAGVLRPDAPVYVTSRAAGDDDKLRRALYDSMSGIVFKDDSQVAVVSGAKLYADSPRVEVQVEPLTCLPDTSDLPRIETVDTLSSGSNNL